VTRNDILIIGAGPSGLFPAAERDPKPHREARATAIQPGTLDILDSVGLLQPFVDAAERVRCSRLYGAGMAELGALSHDGIARRLRPGVEAGARPARLGTPSAARALRGGAPHRGQPRARVSDQVHSSIIDVLDAARQGRAVQPGVVDPVAAALVRSMRAMIDVDYAGSPLVVDHAANTSSIAGPRPG